MTLLFISWVAVTIVLLVLLAMRRRLESREQDWLPLTTTSAAEIKTQEEIEKKVHGLTPLVHWVEALDVVLLLVLAVVWIYKGINSVQW